MARATFDFHCRRPLAVLELSSIVAQCESQAPARFSLGDLGLRISLVALCGMSAVVEIRWKERVMSVVGWCVCEGQA
jgi:hypothetical protein